MMRKGRRGDTQTLAQLPDAEAFGWPFGAARRESGENPQTVGMGQSLEDLSEVVGIGLGVEQPSRGCANAGPSTGSSLRDGNPPV